MSKEVFSRYDSADYLKTDEDITAYLEAAAEEGDDPAFLARALGVVARARNRLVERTTNHAGSRGVSSEPRLYRFTGRAAMRLA